MGKFATLAPRVPTTDLRVVPPEPKRTDPHYSTPEHFAWRAKVLHRAGHRCEAVEIGRRCDRAAPDYQMYADHIIEIKDGGPKTDPANGQCLCAVHHTKKTLAARDARFR